jgi:hypothetical protein
MRILITSVALMLALAAGVHAAYAQSGTLDITDRSLIYDFLPGEPDPEPVLRSYIVSGRGTTGLGATWTGTGITSSTAAADVVANPESTSVAYADNATLPLGPYASFGGKPVDLTAVLIRYTRTGDATLDGRVNDDDVTIFSATFSPGVLQPYWALGDFDYNGFVDNDDATLLGTFYDPAAPPIRVATPSASADSGTSGASVAAVPEPSAVAMLLAGAAVAAVSYWRRTAIRRSIIPLPKPR